jgi:thiol:disulfide interchange protein
MSPIVDGLEQQFTGQVVVQRINAKVGDGPEIMQAYRIPGHPVTMIIDAGGNEKLRLIGPQTQAKLERELQKTLK